MHNPKIGILLVNLGTPSAATPKAVKYFLAEFLSDSRVIDLPSLPWQILLRSIILPLRAKTVAKNYKKIWTKRGSPLLFHSQDIVEALNQKIISNNKPYHATLAMSYGEPGIVEGLLNLRKYKIEKLLILPLYPQYSSTTTASVFDLVANSFSKCPDLPEIRFIKDYHEHPLYIQALAQSIKTYKTKEKTAHLVFSYHGLPIKYCDRGDPYPAQCYRTTKALVQLLALNENDYSMCFQSKFGRAKWLEPSTEETLTILAKKGIKNVNIICPGFACDCLETLEEVAIRFRNVFLSAGGETFNYIPAMNATKEQIEMLYTIILESTQGWPIEQ